MEKTLSTSLSTWFPDGNKKISVFTEIWIVFDLFNPGICNNSPRELRVVSVFMNDK